MHNTITLCRKHDSVFIGLDMMLRSVSWCEVIVIDRESVDTAVVILQTSVWTKEKGHSCEGV